MNPEQQEKRGVEIRTIDGQVMRHNMAEWEWPLFLDAVETQDILVQFGNVWIKPRHIVTIRIVPV